MSVVLPKSEIDRIRSSLVSVSEQVSTRETGLELQMKSKRRVQTWSNTLEGKRILAETERRRKLEAEEEARRQVDEIEAKLQLEIRREKIERANEALAKESDRVKTFSSAMMMSDVLAEREAQVRLKEELIKLERIRDEKYQDMMKHNYRTLLERELREKHDQERKQKDMLLIQKQQLQESIQRKLDEITDNMNEGDMLKRKAAEDLEAAKTLEAQRKEAASHAVRETLRANEYLKELKEREVRRNIRESARIAEYAKLKDETAAKIKAREKELFDHKQAIKQRMIDRQAEEMRARIQKQQQLLNKQVQQKEEDDNRLAEEKQAKLRAWQEQLESSRKHQLERKRLEEQEQKLVDEKTREIQKQLFARLEKDECDEANERKAACLRLAREQLHQIELTKQRKVKEQRGEIEVVNRAKQAILTDLTDFHRYAEHVIKEYASDGKNVIPMIKELRNYKKHLMD